MLCWGAENSFHAFSCHHEWSRASLKFKKNTFLQFSGMESDLTLKLCHSQSHHTMSTKVASIFIKGKVTSNNYLPLIQFCLKRDTADI